MNSFLYCFVIVGQISIQLASLLSTATFLKRFLTVRLRRSARKAAKNVFLKRSLLFLLFGNFEKY